MAKSHDDDAKIDPKTYYVRVNERFGVSAHPRGARRVARCHGDRPRPQFVIPRRRPSAGQSNESAEVVLTPKGRKGAAAAGGTAARELGYFM
jgi:hypothetical protein